MFRHLIKFSVLLFFSAGLGYVLHFYINSTFFPEIPPEILSFSYKYNFGITFIFTSTLIFLSEKFKEQLGFFFMASGFIKLAIYFYLIKSSGFDTGRPVFFHFFIPYVICTAVEIYSIIKIINEANFQKDK